MFSKKWFAGILLLSGVWSAQVWAADRVYIMAGQSNMMGRAKTHYLPPTYRKTPTNVTFYYQGRERKLAQYAYFGPEVSFAHNVARAFPQDNHIIIKHVATGSSIQQWLPGQRLYQGLLRQVKFSLQTENPNIDAVIWMQGENDARTRDKAVQYAPRLTRFIHALRKDLNAANSQFVLGEISPEDKAFPMVPVVQEAQRKVNNSVPNTQMVSTQGLGKIFDHVHFSAPGQMELGRRFAQAYINRAR
ncbi:MAG: sialate O-acetylesterase [Thiolinea sp.]